MAPKTQGILAILTAVLVWAGWMITTRMLAFSHLNPYDIAALRFAIAGAALLPVVLKRGWGIGPGLRGSLSLTFFLGPVYVIVVATGMHFAPASHTAALVNGFMVLTSMVLGAFWLKEPFSPQKKIGSWILLSGVAAIVYAKLGGEGNIGHALFALGGCLWAMYGLNLKRWKANPWHATAVMSVFSALIYLPLYFLFLRSADSGASWGELVFHGTYQGLLTAVLATYLYGRAVVLLGASTASAFVPLVLVITLLLAIPLLGEWPAPVELLGVSLVFAGMLVIAWGARASAPAKAKRGSRSS